MRKIRTVKALETMSGKPKLVISPGHCKGAKGAKYHGLAEHDETVKVISHMLTTLKDLPIDFIVVSGSLSQKVKVANEFKPDASVEVHFNAFKVESVDGIETLYGSGGNESILARCIQDELTEALPDLNDRGIKDTCDEFVFIRRQKTAVIVEPFFMSNPDSAKRLKMPTQPYHIRVADAIVRGIAKYFGVDK